MAVVKVPSKFCNTDELCGLRNGGWGGNDVHLQGTLDNDMLSGCQKEV